MTDRPYLTQTAQGLMVAMPPDAAGDREMLTINQAHARLDAYQREVDEHDPDFVDCDYCALYDLLNGIR
jgi:hypothetical protein